MVGPFSISAGLTSTPTMDDVFSDTAQIQAMLRFEAALSSALEHCKLAPQGSAAVFDTLLQQPFLTPERAAVIQARAAASGNVAIPFLKLLTEAVAAIDPDIAAALHTGATSQDLLDSALVLCMQQAFALLQADLHLLCCNCAALAGRYAETTLAGRTWLQQGPPITLGLKFAGFLSALRRQQKRLAAAERAAIELQFGGAVGTLASLGPHGDCVAAALSIRLDLPRPALPWHTQRDCFAEVACALGNLVGTLGKLARDLSLMMQTEVAEVAEPAAPGRGGSSTMPHKRNPVACAAVLAAAVRSPGLVATMLSCMVQEHERGLGGWQAEWPVLPELFRLTAGALAHMAEVTGGLEVNLSSTAANLAVTGGLTQAEAVVAALTSHLGRANAHELLERASQAAIAQDRSLREILASERAVAQHLSAAELDLLLDPANYLGSTALFILRALADEPKGSD